MTTIDNTSSPSNTTATITTEVPETPDSIPSDQKQQTLSTKDLPVKALRPKTGAPAKYSACYVDLLPPCNAACPAGENIQAWLSLAQGWKFKEAWEEILKNNPMPAIHGRVCYHPCEASCNRQHFDSTVSIHAVERFLGDMALEEKWTIPQYMIAPSSGKKVLVIGAGPAGLSASYHLQRLGHAVSLYDNQAVLGGMMHIGIPDYRLPAKILAGEAERIIAMGVELKLNYKVYDLLAEKERGKFDAVFLAIGAHRGRLVNCEQQNPCPMWDSIQFLKAIKQANLPKLTNLIVYGGSNTAMDVARCAKRVGVQNVTVVYHRSRQRMAAFKHEIEEAIEEGVQITVLHALKTVIGSKATFNVVELDASGSPQPTGQEDTLDADMIVFALGQSSETDFLKTIEGIEMKSNGCVLVDDYMMTGREGIFAGGDMLPFDQSVTIANGHGKKAANNIDAYFQGGKYVTLRKHKVANYENLNVWFQEKSAQMQQSLLEPATRVQSFNEVVGGFDKHKALYEAKRCFSCGNCFECDGCYAVCPEKAITKLGFGKRYKIDDELCSGCRACKNQCPCNAIDMVKEMVFEFKL